MTVTKKNKKEAKKFKTKLDSRVASIRKSLLRGRILVIDPSSGSKESSPGYAEFINGKMVDCGIIEVPYSKKVHHRLRSIKDCLEADFSTREPYDVLILENLTINQFSKYRAGSLLIESVGVFLACIPSDHVLYVAPASWRAYVKRKWGDAYEKSDMNDAIAMGELVMERAQHWENELG